MYKMFIYSWNRASKGALALSSALEIKRIKIENSSFEGRDNRMVINWGATFIPSQVSYCRVINPYIKKVTNKLSFFKMVGDSTRIPKFTTKKSEVIIWLGEGGLVVGRKRFKGRGGVDIIFSSDYTSIIDFLRIPVAFYTLYIKKRDEFRVHVFNGEVIDVQKKVLRAADAEGNPIDPQTIDFRIRTHTNGFIFQRENIHPNPDVLAQALAAMNACGLTFGAVDVIWNSHQEKAYVLEINTAPGIEGATVEKYATKFRNLASAP